MPRSERRTAELNVNIELRSFVNAFKLPEILPRPPDFRKALHLTERMALVMCFGRFEISKRMALVLICLGFQFFSQGIALLYVQSQRLFALQ